MCIPRLKLWPFLILKKGDIRVWSSFIVFWSPGFYEEERVIRGQLWNTAELLLGKLPYLLLCFLEPSEVCWQWACLCNSSSRRDVCSSSWGPFMKFTFSPQFYWHYLEKLCLFLFTDLKFLLWLSDCINTDTIMWSGRRFLKRNGFLFPAVFLYWRQAQKMAMPSES